MSCKTFVFIFLKFNQKPNWKDLVKSKVKSFENFNHKPRATNFRVKTWDIERPFSYRLRKKHSIIIELRFFILKNKC